MNESLAYPRVSHGDLMINEIDIKNFRCFKHLNVRNPSLVNVIVGDNGSGKTAILEAIFLALGFTAEVFLKIRLWRGYDPLLPGTIAQVEEGMTRDLFFNSDSNIPIRITLTGDGTESRSLRVSREERPTIPTLATSGVNLAATNISQGSGSSGRNDIQFIWTDSKGDERFTSPSLGPLGVQYVNNVESMPEHFFVSAQNPIAPTWIATMFSELNKRGGTRTIVKQVTKEFPIITDLSIELLGTAGLIHANVRRSEGKIPLNSVSSGINRAVAILTLIASAKSRVVIVDEIESGIYHSHMEATWKMILSLCREYKCQLFASTHSAECLEALGYASADRVSDISFWRMETASSHGPTVRMMSGSTLAAAIRSGGEVR